MSGTLSSAYNKKKKKKKYPEILLHYGRLFVKGDVIIGEWSIFGVEIFLCYSRYFVKGDFVIGRVECSCTVSSNTAQQQSRYRERTYMSMAGICLKHESKICDNILDLLEHVYKFL